MGTENGNVGFTGRYSEPTWSVGEVARLAGITVRTLHHWDDIGLVSPELRSAAGYRLYGPADLALVHRVVVFRELGMPLADVASVVRGETSASEQLRRQSELLGSEIERLRRMRKSVERMRTMEETGITLTPEEAKEIFGDTWVPEYQEEAKERWGDTEQWAQSTSRTAKFSKEDWRRVKEETDELNEALGAAKRAGYAPDSEEAAALAERHRASIDRFYDCTHAMQVCLARMYTTDQRFTDTYDAVEPGLAEWLRAAVEANARRHGVDPETASWDS